MNLFGWAYLAIALMSWPRIGGYLFRDMTGGKGDHVDVGLAALLGLMASLIWPVFVIWTLIRKWWTTAAGIEHE